MAPKKVKTRIFLYSAHSGGCNSRTLHLPDKHIFSAYVGLLGLFEKYKFDIDLRLTFRENNQERTNIYGFLTFSDRL